MKVITGRNVQQILPTAIRYLRDFGLPRDSRNGPVLQAPVPVTTLYHCPMERVLFWPDRDANPFFHLYEALWMLAGRNDVKGPARYAGNMRNFSDDGETLHGAYGYRWRNFRWIAREGDSANDQLKSIIETLRRNKEDRRCVLEMWSAHDDLGRDGKDLPCNLTATFQIGLDKLLHLVVFCRSNDIIWGCYGANAVHFSLLLEYMALAIGVPVGTYTQVSVNWHAYLDTFEKVKPVLQWELIEHREEDPYANGLVKTIPMHGHFEMLDENISSILHEADNFFPKGKSYSDPFSQMCYTMLYAHHLYKTLSKYAGLEILDSAGRDIDWYRAGAEWLERRK